MDDLTGAQVVLCVNANGVIEAFGPYGDDEAFEVSQFASRLVPTWRVTLSSDEFGKDGACNRIGIDGTSTDFPRRSVDHPTRPPIAPLPE